MRVALYARVSTEEQVKHGLSVDAQVEALVRWAAANNHSVVDVYKEEGVSARKAPAKRPELQRLLSDIPARKTELVAFTRLDRWTRNVKGYYQVQEHLERHGVAWCAIQEDYETATAGGRMKVNIMLSVAENEADRTSERIKSVYAHKVALGQAINGSLPLGLSIQDKRVVPNEFAPAVVAAFERYAETGSRNAVQQTLDEYGKHLSIVSVMKILHNRLYIGEYRDNPVYCEPIVDKGLFYRVQRDMASRYVRNAPTGRVYLFSGIIFCAECGRRLTAMDSYGTRYYRCSIGHFNYKTCGNGKYYREDEIESAVISALSELVKGKQVVKQPRKRRSNKAAVEAKLERLKELYLDGDISKEKYKLRRDELAASIRPAEDARPLVVLGDNFKADYAAKSEAEKKEFMHKVVSRIVCHPDGLVDVFFADAHTYEKPTDDELL